MGGSTKMGMGRMTRVKAVSVMAWGNIVHTLHLQHITFSVTRSDGGQFNRSRAWNKNVFKTTVINEKLRQRVWEHLATTRGRLLTCLAAILEDPTTFPSSSNTSMPSDSSVCLIKPTLQMFAVALRIKTSSFYNLIHLHRKKRRKSAIEDKSAFPGNIGADFFEKDDWGEFSKKKKEEVQFVSVQFQWKWWLCVNARPYRLNIAAFSEKPIFV